MPPRVTCAQRTDDAAPAASERTAEGAAARVRARRTRRRRLPPPPPPPPPPAQSSADQNLAEMAQRLEAALRRPAGDTVGARRSRPNRRRAAPRAAQRAAGAAGRPRRPKSGFENLEDEMASLLGRPKNSS